LQVKDAEEKAENAAVAAEKAREVMEEAARNNTRQAKLAEKMRVAVEGAKEAAEKAAREKTRQAKSAENARMKAERAKEEAEEAKEVAEEAKEAAEEKAEKSETARVVAEKAREEAEEAAREKTRQAQSSEKARVAAEKERKEAEEAKEKAEAEATKEKNLARKQLKEVKEEAEEAKKEAEAEATLARKQAMKHKKQLKDMTEKAELFKEAVEDNAKEQNQAKKALLLSSILKISQTQGAIHVGVAAFSLAVKKDQTDRHDRHELIKGLVENTNKSGVVKVTEDELFKLFDSVKRLNFTEGQDENLVLYDHENPNQLLAYSFISEKAIRRKSFFSQLAREKVLGSKMVLKVLIYCCTSSDQTGVNKLQDIMLSEPPCQSQKLAALVQDYFSPECPEFIVLFSDSDFQKQKHQCIEAQPREAQLGVQPYNYLEDPLSKMTVGSFKFHGGRYA
jgi:hypothetical protein